MVAGRKVLPVSRAYGARFGFTRSVSVGRRAAVFAVARNPPAVLQLINNILTGVQNRQLSKIVYMRIADWAKFVSLKYARSSVGPFITPLTSVEPHLKSEAVRRLTMPSWTPI